MYRNKTITGNIPRKYVCSRVDHEFFEIKIKRKRSERKKKQQQSKNKKETVSISILSLCFHGFHKGK